MPGLEELAAVTRKALRDMGTAWGEGYSLGIEDMKRRVEPIREPVHRNSLGLCEKSEMGKRDWDGIW